MEINLKIVLVEDKMSDVEMIKQRFTENVEWLRARNLLSEMKFDSICIEHVKGSVSKVYKNEEHYYYSVSDVSRILSLLEKTNKNEKIGVLTDVLLMKEEDEKARVNNFSEISLVRQICDNVEGKCPVYFVTSVQSFGSRAWSILGKEELIHCYIQKEVVDMPSRKGIARVLYWLCNEEVIPKELSKKIERMEWEDWGEDED